jgi:hypothetical protein
MSSAIPIICGWWSISLYLWFSLSCIRFCPFSVARPNTLANNLKKRLCLWALWYPLSMVSLCLWSRYAVWDCVHFLLHLLLEQTLTNNKQNMFCIVVPISHIGSINSCLYVSLYLWVFIHSVLLLLLVLYKTINICLMSSVIPIDCGWG